MRLLVNFWLQQNLKQGRFLVMFIAVVALFALNAAIYSGRYHEDLETQGQRTRALQAQYEALENPDDIAGSSFLIAMPTNRWRFIADGNLEDVPTGRYVGAHNASLPQNPNRQKQQLIVAWDVDIVFIVSVVLTFLASVLTFDSISGERENGTLRLLMANALPRWRIVISKIAAAVITLALPLIAGIVVNALTFSMMGGLTLDLEALWMYLLVTIVALLLILVFVSLGVLVSALTRTAITSLVILLLLWTLLIIVLPGSAQPIAKEAHKPMSPNEFTRSMQSLQTQFWESVFAAGGADRSPDIARADGFRVERIWGEQRAGLISSQQNLIDQQVRDYYRQADIGRGISRISPGMVFHLTIARLAGTDLAGVVDFLDQAGQYRSGLYSYMAAQDALDPDSPHILNSDGRGYLSTRPLSGSAPPFVYHPQSIMTRLEGAFIDLAILISLGACILLGAVLAFNRYDVRS